MEGRNYRRARNVRSVDQIAMVLDRVEGVEFCWLAYVQLV
jgi:hypothetical protein